jgi:hypothetical protein
MDPRDISSTLEFIGRLLPKLTTQEIVELLELLSNIEDRIIKEANNNECVFE